MKRHPDPDGPVTYQKSTHEFAQSPRLGGVDGPVMYQIQVQGKLDEGWSDWFTGMTVAFERASDGLPITTLAGPIADQAILRGVLNRIWDLNLTLLSVTRGGVQ